MLQRYFRKRFEKALQEALECPLQRIDELEVLLGAIQDEWSTASDRLDATYTKVHRELGHITKRQALDADDDDEEKPTPRRALTRFGKPGGKFQ